MAKIGKNSGYQEIRGKLGFFGWLWRILLFLWQVAMVAWISSYGSLVNEAVQVGGAEGAGAAIGGTLGIGLIIAVWVGGTIVIGLFVLLTRRTKAIVQIQK